MSRETQIVETRRLRDVDIVTREVVLDDGRRLAFAEFGDPAGPVLFYFHGSGSCRYEAVTGDAPARDLGVRLIAVDRPGFGRSTAKPGRRIADVAFDIDQLTAALGIGRFAVAGLSGGAPHALALSLLRHERVIAGASLNTAGERASPLWRQLPLGLRLQVAPMINRFVTRHVLYPALLKDPARALARSRGLTKAERDDLLGGDGAFVDALFREGNVQGLDAVLHEIGLFYHQPWGLNWGNLKVPYTIFQGEHDLMLPFVRLVAARHPTKVRLVEIPGGHLSGGTPQVWSRMLELVFGGLA